MSRARPPRRRFAWCSAGYTSVFSAFLAPLTRLASLASVALLLAAGVPVGEADGWRELPFFGADVRSLAFDPTDPSRVLAGTSAGQVYESVDSGSSWRAAGARVALPGWVISDLEFDAHAPDRVWAALWSLWGVGGEVVVSDDGGRTWQPRGMGLPGKQVYALELSPDRPGEIYAATRQGVWASRDSGSTWSELTAALPRLGKVTSLLVDPYDHDTVYAGSWRRAYRSDDRGLTWRGIFEGMVLDSEVFSLQPGPAGEGDLWASTCGWVYHGRDRGARWQRHTNGLPERRTPSFAVLPDGGLLAGTVAGVFGSDDGGASWRRRGPEVAVSTIAVHPTRPGLVLHGSEGSGVWRSTDGGRTFESVATGLVGMRVTDVVATSPGLAISVRNTEGRDGVHRFDGRRLEPVMSADLPEVLDLATLDRALYAATERGLWHLENGAWRPVTAAGTGRVEAVRVDGEWLLARSRHRVFARHAAGDYSLEVEGKVRDAAVHGGVFWILEERRLKRWDLTTAEDVDTPGEVLTLSPWQDRLLVDTRRGRYELSQSGAWSRSEFAARRFLPTGDAMLPTLALWRDGSASLHASDGTERVRLELPIPARDVSATVLESGRIHLATAGYGLIWSHVVELAGPGAVEPAAAVAVSSR